MTHRNRSLRTVFATGAFIALFAATTLRAAEPGEKATEKTDKSLPKLVDLGKGTCIPCKKMMPILGELKEDYAGVLEVEYIDIGKNPEAAKAYGIRLIPTQVFLSPEGKELYRHQGFYSKESILKRWKELGYELKPKASDKKE